MSGITKQINFNRTIEQLKMAFVDGQEQLLDDEFLGKDGLPYCRSCKGKRYYVLDDGAAGRMLSCDCNRKKWKEQEEEEQKQQRLQEFNSRKKLSLLGGRYINVMFSDATITKSNAAAYEKCKNYVKNSQEVYTHNIGMYIYGNNSTGKTFLTACMCNELVRKGHYCVYTNLATILDEIRASYNGMGLGATDLIRKLQSYDFAFIDDLGKEFIGREYNASSSKWAEEKFFEILNARYNAHKPTIFSSNYSIVDLATVLNLDKAIVGRIVEMSTRVIKLDGDDFRESVRQSKREIAKRLGI